jgi:uncharacterized protein YbjT (DUF2867 family)
MKIAVIGGTGVSGGPTVADVQRRGHEVIVVARSRGVDVITGAGLDAALEGVDAVIQASTTSDPTPEGQLRFFTKSTANLLAAEQRAGVKHHVVLSVMAIDRMTKNAHVAAKVAQEQLVERGPIPYTIVRVAQFHEFPGMMVDWLRQGDSVTLPPALLQPVDVADTAEVLVQLAEGTPLGRAPDLAGPQPEDLVDMARRTLAARGQSLRIIPSWRAPMFSDVTGETMLPGPGARLGSTTFDTWLRQQTPAGAR